MIQLRRLRLGLVLVLAAVLVAVAALWLHGALPYGDNHSPLPTPSHLRTSPLPTPTPSSAEAAVPPAWKGASVALVWVALGIVLALGVARIILGWNRHRA
jgi:hypothetical protein